MLEVPGLLDSRSSCYNEVVDVQEMSVAEGRIKLRIELVNCLPSITYFLPQSSQYLFPVIKVTNGEI